MPRTARQILRSNDGASIIMALFLFLVCAALSAVILTAATAASGRVAGLAAADQKYYNTTSAAGLFRDMMGDDGITAVVECTQKTVTTRAADGSATTTTEDPVCKVDGTLVGDLADTGLPLTEQVVQKLLLSWVSTDGNSVWDWQLDGAGSVDYASAASSLPAMHFKHDVQHDAQGLSSQASDLLGADYVTINASVNDDGSLVFTFEGTGNAEGGGNTRGTAGINYVLQLTCQAEVMTSSKARTQVDAASKTVTRTDTKTTAITWRPTELKRVTADDSSNGSSGQGGA